MASKPPPPPTEIDGVITVVGLATEGRQLAYIRNDGRYHVTTAGHARIGRELRAKAQANIEQGMGRWTRPIGAPLIPPAEVEK